MSHVYGMNLLSEFDAEESKSSADAARFDPLIGEAEALIAEANRSREAAYGELAARYCDAQEKYAGELTQVSRELQRLFDERAARRLAVEKEIGERHVAARALKTRLEEAFAAWEQVQAQHDQLAERTATLRAGRPEFAELTREAESTQDQARQAVADRDALLREVRRKRVAYEDDPVFMHLQDRRYGRNDYKGAALGRVADDWLARFSHWERNSRNFRLLCELPGFAEKRVQESQAESKRCAELLAQRVLALEQDTGLWEARQRLREQEAAVAVHERGLEGLEGCLEGLLGEQRLLEENKDGYVQAAKKAIKDMLAGEPLRQLRERAQRTGDPKAVEQVQAIANAEEVVKCERIRIKKLRESRDACTNRATKIREARKHFRDHYGKVADRFDSGFDLNSLLGLYIVGSLSETAFWGKVDAARYRVAETFMHSSSGSDSWSSSSSDSWSSSSGSFDCGGGGGGGGGGCDGGGGSFGGGD